MSSAAPSLLEHHNVEKWQDEHKDAFGPPICNKLMHRDQLSVMFVGGPNSRTDFHLDHGSEFFWQFRGRMELPTIQRGERVKVEIGEGQVFLLPSRIPHAPQRPVEGSMGLVIERARLEGTEKDGLRWYTDFEKADEVLFERYFQCFDLGRDLKPVVEEYMSSEEYKSKVPTEKSVPRPQELPLIQDTETVIPAPFDLWPFLERSDNAKTLAEGGTVNLFGDDHPDKEIKVLIVGGESTQTTTWEHETWLYQLRGTASVVLGSGEPVALKEKECAVVPRGATYTIERSAGSIGMVVTQDPNGNVEKRKRQEAEFRAKLGSQ